MELLKLLTESQLQLKKSVDGLLADRQRQQVPMVAQPGQDNFTSSPKEVYSSANVGNDTYLPAVVNPFQVLRFGSKPVNSPPDNMAYIVVDFPNPNGEGTREILEQIQVDLAAFAGQQHPGPEAVKLCMKALWMIQQMKATAELHVATLDKLTQMKSLMDRSVTGLKLAPADAVACDDFYKALNATEYYWRTRALVYNTLTPSDQIDKQPSATTSVLAAGKLGTTATMEGPRATKPVNTIFKDLAQQETLDQWIQDAEEFYLSAMAGGVCGDQDPRFQAAIQRRPSTCSKE